MEKTGPGDVREPHVFQASPRLKPMLSKEAVKPPALVKVNFSFTVLMVAFAIETVTGMIQPQAPDRDEKKL